MFGFMIKKSFADIWDNLFACFLINVLCTVIAVGAFIVITPCVNMGATLVTWALTIVAVIILTIMVFAYGDSAATIANFNSVRLVDYFKSFKTSFLDGLFFGLMISGIAIFSYIGIKYYWSEQFLTKFPMMGIFLGALLVWIDVFLILSLQWFLPIRSLMHNDFKKCLKKCFIIFFDNTGFSIAMFIHNIILLALSIVFLGMVPAWTGMLIAQTDALRLRLYKYDYLEEHPELQSKYQRKKIPWEELIYDDKETLGPRKLKTLLFPWKE